MPWSGEEWKNPNSSNSPKSVAKGVDQNEKIRENRDLPLFQRKVEQPVAMNFCTEF